MLLYFHKKNNKLRLPLNKNGTKNLLNYVAITESKTWLASKKSSKLFQPETICVQPKFS